jgi:hypothetical protein
LFDVQDCGAVVEAAVSSDGFAIIFADGAANAVWAAKKSPTPTPNKLKINDRALFI